MEENFSFGYWLRRQRLARDWRQDELAARLGVATVTLRKLEAEFRADRGFAGRFDPFGQRTDLEIARHLHQRLDHELARSRSRIG